MSEVEALVEGLHDAVALVEVDGTVRAASSKARALLGLEGGVSSLPELATEPAGVTEQLVLWAMSDASVPAVFTLRSTDEKVRADGRRLPGSQPALVVVRLQKREQATRDFDALSESLASLREEMRHRRTLELRNQRLLSEQRAATERAERLNRVKDDFLGSVSHELRTPLNAISGWAQLLAKPAGAAMLSRGVEVIQRNCDVQRRLIDDLVDLSRLASGSLHLRLERVHVHDAIGRAVARVAEAAEAGGVELVVPPRESSPVLIADDTRLEQIAWNLLSNAVKYTPRGGLVEVSVQRLVQLAAVEIVVADTGRGMEPEVAARVFDTFWKGSSRTEGLGMGLALVQQLVRLHGGEVSAHSDGAGTGCRFVVRLPDEAVAVTTPPPAPGMVFPPGAPRTVSSPGPRLTGARILLVEDHDDSRELLAHMFASEGASVQACSTASEALHSLAGSVFDLLISDLRLVGEGDEVAELDGCDLLQQVRATEGPNQQVPAVALTAFGGAADRQRTADAGFQQHVVKPVDSEVIVRVVGQLLDGRRA